MTTYDAKIAYVAANGNATIISEEDFATVEKATKWVSDNLCKIMLDWAEINPNGLIVCGEVYNDEIGFSDLYELKCGL